MAALLRRIPPTFSRPAGLAVAFRPPLFYRSNPAALCPRTAGSGLVAASSRWRVLLSFLALFSFPLLSRMHLADHTTEACLQYLLALAEELASVSNNLITFDVRSAYPGIPCPRHYPVPRKFETHPPDPRCSGCVLEAHNPDPCVAILASAYDSPPFVERLIRPALKPLFGYYILPYGFQPQVRRETRSL